MASGTSDPVAVAAIVFSWQQGNAQPTRVDGIDLDVMGSPKSVGAPIANGAQIGYLGKEGFRNRNWEYTFEKINEPDWGTDDSIARFTGDPINHPDHIADYHIIGLARAVDQIIKPAYDGRLLARYNTPHPGG